jgi:type VI secretion system secreted protein VgrG
MGYTQDERKFSLSTPLGKDVLLFKGLTGEEGLSRLFEFEVLALAENKTKVPFDGLLGQKVTVKMKMGVDGTPCFLNGLCHRVRQGGRDETFTTYRIGMVPDVWKLSKRTRSRVFQQKKVPDILKAVFAGFPVEWEFSSDYEPRDYCVQYRESDLNFACRIMEEEGIWFCFKHEDGSHTMVVGDSATVHPDVPGETTVKYEELEGGVRDEERIFSWEKTQELRSGKVTLWDHHFELPRKHLEAEEPIVATAMAGTVTHKLRVGGNEDLELYDWPGEYAQRYDGVGPTGGNQPEEVQKVFKDNERTATLRMDEETVAGLVAHGETNARHLRAGHAFTLEKHFNADGGWVVLEALYEALQTGDYRSGNDDLHFVSSFTCIPEGMRYRPPRTTAKPIIAGTQTAVVVGPKGEEIFTDKYGRVKVQFHWDRDGKYDPKSSCWIRVAQLIAGRRWGASFWPRVGQEVVVAFEEGDPDCPIIVGVVYNPDQMPPYLGEGPDPKHRNDNRLMGVKSNTTLGGVGYNEWRFDDTKGKEQVFVHAEKDLDVRVKSTLRETVGGDVNRMVGGEKDGRKWGDSKEKVYRDVHSQVGRHRDEHIGGDMKLMVGVGDEGDGNVDLWIKGDRTEYLEKSDRTKVDGDHVVVVNHDVSVAAGKDWIVSAKGNASLSSDGTFLQAAGRTMVVRAEQEVTLKGPGGFVKIDAAGVTIQGTLVRINSGGSPGELTALRTKSLDFAKEARPVTPFAADTAKSGQKSS